MFLLQNSRFVCVCGLSKIRDDEWNFPSDHIENYKCMYYKVFNFKDWPDQRNVVFRVHQKLNNVQCINQKDTGTLASNFNKGFIYK